MIRRDFDKLEVAKQVEYINKKLIEGYTLTNLCKDIGISRSTIRDRFKKISYEYNKETNQYESIVEIVDADPRILATSNKIIKDDINEGILSMQKSSNKVVGTDSEILTNMISSYDENLSKLNEMYNWYKLQSSNKVVETEKLKIEDFKGDLVVRSYKLYEPIQKEFTDFCKVNNKYKVQDILCQAIKEFLEKYK